MVIAKSRKPRPRRLRDAFVPSTSASVGVKTMSVEATEQIGPIVVWRKDLCKGLAAPENFEGGSSNDRGRAL
jgi:hypothetical protein